MISNSRFERCYKFLSQFPSILSRDFFAASHESGSVQEQGISRYVCEFKDYEGDEQLHVLRCKESILDAVFREY